MLDKELRAGRIAGPFDQPPFQTFICSPLGARPKKESGKIRMIHDLSYPKGAPNTVNSSIPQEHSSVQSYYWTMWSNWSNSKVVAVSCLNRHPRSLQACTHPPRFLLSLGVPIWGSILL